MAYPKLTSLHCPACGRADFTFALGITQYYPVLAVYRDGQMTLDGDRMTSAEMDTDESARLFCNGCSARYAVPNFNVREGDHT